MAANAGWNSDEHRSVDGAEYLTASSDCLVVF
jgi:hypothetical protein